MVAPANEAGDVVWRRSKRARPRKPRPNSDNNSCDSANDLRAMFILHARTSAARAVNGELVLLYWDIGRSIVEKQHAAGWGESVIERLASDLRAEFPDMRGFSARNMRDMKRMWLAYSGPEFWRQAVAILAKNPDEGNPIWRQPVAKLEAGGQDAFLQQLVAEAPWGHHLVILNKLTDPAARLYYLRATAQLGWSRNVLLNQIKAGAYEHAVKEKKTHNFELTLPSDSAGEAQKLQTVTALEHFICLLRQMLFMTLARKARGICGRGMLSGWLFKVMGYACADARKREQRRKRHEAKAAAMIETACVTSSAIAPSPNCRTLAQYTHRAWPQ